MKNFDKVNSLTDKKATRIPTTAQTSRPAPGDSDPDALLGALDLCIFSTILS